MSFNGILTIGDKMTKVMVLVNNPQATQSERYYTNSCRIGLKYKNDSSFFIKSLEHRDSIVYYPREYIILKAREVI